MSDQKIPEEKLLQAYDRMEAPQSWMVMEAEVSNLVRLHDKHKDEFWGREGVQLTLLPFYLKAVINSIKAYPRMNAVWSAQAVEIKPGINLDLTIMAGDRWGAALLEHADRISLAGFAHIQEKIHRRTSANPSANVLSNMGTFGVKIVTGTGSILSAPAISKPQTASLSFESIMQRAIFVNDSLTKSLLINLCLSFDRRAVYEAYCAKFLQLVKKNLEEYVLEELIY
ncbi:2-oxo acid dehydrogenase subunit E2 [Paenibacillus alkaliterrae]|uniref:2-oxo acid dehydrogenase subunit E2 n=1 Tax=Paenibacillus alkaliterrae TaxID=320909 RepID=UPI001F441400|nr:2-oxo acid dehydrogenase subunit E2 [Paenibacillus alkaliterrae]MCF2940156.1 2-oxo acid dehydrogenase subunit E2 [Paenibacillus alkaliterrae]